MTFDSLMLALRDTDVMWPLLGSLVAGGLIGAERELQAKPAGLRTHTLVCFAAALMTLLGLRMEEWYAALPVGTQVVSDMSRMPHAVLTGVGFLGAGVIFRDGASVQGLTTAASLWLTAALGIVFGTGLMELATIGTLVALVVLVLLRYAQRLAPPPPVLALEFAVPLDPGFDSAALLAVLARHGLIAGPLHITRDAQAGRRRYRLTLAARAPVVDLEALAQLLEAEGLRDFMLHPLEAGALAPELPSS